VLVGTTSIEKSELLSKFLVRAGITHEVLNAKQHAKEATIIAQAGRLKAVTIATNMAGRGTDIVLGGNFEIMSNNELIKEGIDPDDLTMDEKRKKFAKLYKQLAEEHIKVVELGDCTLSARSATKRAVSTTNSAAARDGREIQGRRNSFCLWTMTSCAFSARSGSPRSWTGSAPRKARSFPTPLSAGRSAARKKRVEARNFEIRKHLKEYDDVMNLQRNEIYGLRQRILKGEDIKDEMLDQSAATLEAIIYKYTQKGAYPENWNLKELYSEVQTLFGVGLSHSRHGAEQQNTGHFV